MDSVIKPVVHTGIGKEVVLTRGVLGDPLVWWLKYLVWSMDESGDTGEVNAAVGRLLVMLATSSDNLPERGSYTAAMEAPMRMRVMEACSLEYQQKGFTTVWRTDGGVLARGVEPVLGTYLCPSRVWLKLSNTTWRLRVRADGMVEVVRGAGPCTAHLELACLPALRKLEAGEEVEVALRVKRSMVWDKFRRLCVTAGRTVADAVMGRGLRVETKSDAEYRTVDEVVAEVTLSMGGLSTRGDAQRVAGCPEGVA